MKIRGIRFYKPDFAFFKGTAVFNWRPNLTPKQQYYLYYVYAQDDINVSSSGVLATNVHAFDENMGQSLILHRL